MIRQILTSFVIIFAAALAWLFLAPGAPETLTKIGITLPFGPPPQTEIARERGSNDMGGPRFNSRPSRVANVVTSKVVMATINDTLNAIAEGIPVRSVTVMAASAGALAEVLVQPGQRVEAGTVIARFDSAAEQIEFDRAQLAARDTEAALQRTLGLANANVVTDTALAAAELANSNARLTLRNAELALERRTITSPIAGSIGLIRVTPGNHVGSQTAITTVDDTSSILIDFWVPERYAAQIRTGMKVTVSAVVLPDRHFVGNISVIDNRIDPASRTLQVQAEIPNTDNALRAGMSFLVSLTFPGENYPAVDPLAILWSTEGSYVWKYADGTAKRVMVEIVQRNSDGVLVRADLEPGDAIITEGILQLNEGTQVRVLEGPGAQDEQVTIAG